MRLQDLVRVLLPKEDHFYTFLERQAAAAHDGAIELGRFREGKTATEVRDAVQELEHRGDAIVHDMENALAKTFVTPIDREDLQSLSSALDDILDLINGAARACVLYGVVNPTEAMLKLIRLLGDCTAALRETMPNLKKHDYARVIEAARAIHLLEKEADAVFREAVRVLFHDPAIDAKVLLREKAVLDDLENAVDRCERVADRLTNLAVKHG